MKRLVSLVSFLLAGGLIFGQSVVLAKKTHGFDAGQSHEMLRASYVEPGPGGKDRVWDLSGMEASGDFQGRIDMAADKDTKGTFQGSDLVLTEQGSRFFYAYDSDELKAWGSMSSSGRSGILLDRPYTKIRYPFRFGDAFEGDYSGTYFSGDMEYPLMGSYSVEADAYGRLILPGGVEVESCLRVVSRRSYTINRGGADPAYELTTYRWYNQERFPLAVIIEIHSTACGNGNTSYHCTYRLPAGKKDAASALPEAEKLLKVYPNPVERDFTIAFELPADDDVLLELYDHTGRKVARLIDRQMEAGSYQESFSADKLKLAPAMYFVRSSIGESSGTTSFLVRD